MKKIWLVLSVIFAILTLGGMTYVLVSGGKANAGFAVIPMVITLILIGLWRNCKV